MHTQYRNRTESRMASKLHVSIANEARSDATGIKTSCLASDAARPTWNASYPVTTWAGRKASKSWSYCMHACTYADIWTSSKRTGLEKALHQIEQAIKRPRTEDVAASDASQKVISNLQDLLKKAQGPGQQVSHSETDNLSENLDQAQSLPSPHVENQEDNLALDDAENPLQLLARASDLQFSPTGARGAQNSPLTLALQTAIPQSSHEGQDPGAKSFFAPVRASRDVGSDIDPIDLGLVTVEETESLFMLYVQSYVSSRSQTHHKLVSIRIWRTLAGASTL